MSARVADCDFQTFLRSEMARCGDGHVLVLCPWELGALPPGAQQLTSCDALDELPAGTREFTLAITAGVLEHLTPEHGGAILATLRDLQARHLLAVVPAVTTDDHLSTWNLERMLAHGLEARTTLGEGDGALTVYGFDIDRYKKTPDWLNARSWANPENWNRFRW